MLRSEWIKEGQVVMLLCLDIGNSHVFGGVFDQNHLTFKFRTHTRYGATSDEHGIFLTHVLRENGIEKTQIQHIIVGSVVPDILYTIRSACIKYFGYRPFTLTAEAAPHIELNYEQPETLGVDRLANAIGALEQYPNQHLIIVDFGTATTICAVHQNRCYLGGAILPGMRLSMNALQNKTAQLKSVEIIYPEFIIGHNTTQSIQSGLFYSQLGAIDMLTKRISKNYFTDKKPIILGTGGFAHLFKKEHLFHDIVPNLVLNGLRIAYLKQKKK